MALTGGTNELGVYEPDIQLLQKQARSEGRAGVGEWREIWSGVRCSFSLDVVVVTQLNIFACCGSKSGSGIINRIKWIILCI